MCGKCFDETDDSIDGFVLLSAYLCIFGVWRKNIITNMRISSSSRRNISSPDLSPAPKHFCQPCLTALKWWNHCGHQHHFHLDDDRQVKDWMDYYSMAVLQCYNNRLQELDWSGEAQKWSSSSLLLLLPPMRHNSDENMMHSGWWRSTWRTRTPGVGCWWQWPWRPGQPLLLGSCDQTWTALHIVYDLNKLRWNNMLSIHIKWTWIWTFWTKHLVFQCLLLKWSTVRWMKTDVYSL